MDDCNRIIYEMRKLQEIEHRKCNALTEISNTLKVIAQSMINETSEEENNE